MSIVRTYVWTTRAQCACGYLWTTPGSPTVVCACGASSIVDDVVIAGDQVTSEAAFKEVVAQDLGLAVEVVSLVQGG